jgi:AraC-like DNA-binding protein
MMPSHSEEERPYVMLVYLRGLFDYLRARNAPLGPVLEVLRLTDQELHDPDRRVDHSLQNEIFDAAERATGDVNVGLHAGESTHLMHFGIGGMLAMTCRTIRELIDVHVRFQRLISTGASMCYEERGGEMVGEATFVDPTPLSRHTLEYTLASHLKLARLMAGFEFHMARVDVTYPEPDDCTEQQRVLGGSIRYGCARERLYFPAEALDLPLATSDGASRPLLELEAYRRLDALRPRVTDEDPQIAGLKQFVADRLPTGSSSVEDAAMTLGVSVRTLQRRLEAHRSNYRLLVDDVRREMAAKYMRSAELSQVDVAYLLGFADQSAFHRAFRRWFATTPGEYRSRSASLE